MIRWTLVTVALTLWITGAVLVLDGTAESLGVALSGLGALSAMAAGATFAAEVYRRARRGRTSAQAVQERLRDITDPDRCCGHVDPLCGRYGCPLDPSWTGDRR